MRTAGRSAMGVLRTGRLQAQVEVLAAETLTSRQGKPEADQRVRRETMWEAAAAGCAGAPRSHMRATATGLVKGY